MLDLLHDYAPWLLIAYIGYMAYNCFIHIRKKKSKFNEQNKPSSK